MVDQAQKIEKQFLKDLSSVKKLIDLDKIEQDYFSRKSGVLTELMKQMKNLSDDERRTVGKDVQEMKTRIEAAYEQKKAMLQSAEWDKQLLLENIDVTEPLIPRSKGGSLHPNTLVQYQLEDLFASMGFTIADGPELESDYYNFESVNIPDDHPARDMQDTFYIKDHSDWVMRTHTSSVQVRAMQKYGVPLRMIAPGRCFRNEATDVRHEHTFYQMEGVVIDKHITISHMKGVLETIAKHLYGPQTKVRLRPKFYPFVEPGMNGEVTCHVCAGAGCKLCKQTGWLEIFGAGMIHPNVLKAGGVNADEYQGFAFGFGLTRLVMLKYKIEDIRHLQSGDLRFLNQFNS